MTSSSAKAPDLHIRRFGRGARKVLGFHCTMAHSSALRGLAKCLGAADVTVTAPDMPSHGRSPDWDGRGSILDSMIAAGRNLLTSPMDLIGHSFGGVVALHLAVERPELVRSLVLYEPVFFVIAELDQPEDTALEERSMQPVHDALSAGDAEGAARLFNRMWGAGDGTHWSDLTEASRAMMTRGVRILSDTNSSITSDPAGLLKPGVLGVLTAPVLLLRGSRSRGIAGTANDGLARRLPNAASKIIDETGHMAPVTHPALVAKQILQFWGKTQPA